MSDDSDDQLDLSSTNFDPLKALSETSRIPIQNAPVLDNISRFMETPDGSVVPKMVRKKPVVPKEEQTEAGTSTDIPVERYVRTHSNVLTKMDTVKGPLEFLKQCMVEEIKVKVYIRNANQIRGFCLGFVQAFDKHWNMVLKDVQEFWSRSRRKSKAVSDTNTNTVSQIQKPEVVVHKRLKRKEFCERNLEQIFLRGEHVVLVMRANT